MRRLLLILALFAGIARATAQDVYTSSGKPGYHKTTKKQKGYDPDKLIIGGGINAGFAGDFANFGISPIAGYRFFDHFSAGIGVGYQFYKYPNPDPYIYNLGHYNFENIVYPSLWARYFVYRNLIFVDASFEYDFINLQGTTDINGPLASYSQNVTNPCLLMGVGVRQQIKGRLAAIAELVYDVLQGPYSPYPHGSPDIKIGFGVGL